MTISIWRYSHLALAVSSFVFIVLASVTGIILAFEPISNKVKPYYVDGAENLTLAEIIPVLKAEYDEIMTLSVDANGFVSASAITKDGNILDGYIDPFSGKKIGDPIKKAALFEFATNLHRSLFLKSTGRILVGIASFLLFLIAVSGLILVLKRQKGIKAFFGKIVKENNPQFFHIVLGRWNLIPIAIITLTGVYLSLFRFEIFPKEGINHKVNYDTLSDSPNLSLKSFAVFKNIRLNVVNEIEFPFSSDMEDFYVLKLTDKELLINQFTGSIESSVDYPSANVLSQLSIALHTGEGSIIWALVLAIACMNILYFVYSGFSMTLKRRKSRIKNIFNKDDCDYIVLVGSENGTTMQYASLFHKALLETGLKVYMDELNNLTTYKNLKHLVIFTATYGQGEPPANARKFKSLLEKHPIKNHFLYSVVGFGSKAYPGFCQYAIQVDQLLSNNKQATSLLDLHTVNNKNFNDLNTWADKWATALGHKIDISKGRNIYSPPQSQLFKIIDRTLLENTQDDTFLITLKPHKRNRFVPGDLLAVQPGDNEQERLYSIGATKEKELVLSIKKHEYGLCSNYLYKLKKQDVLDAQIITNSPFHFPKGKQPVVMIANGTGIAPFLGMINQNSKKQETHLYWGGKTPQAFKIYEEGLQQNLIDGNLSKLHLAYSRLNKQKVYVQDLLNRDAEVIADIVKNKGTVMVCGSLSMQNDVLKALDGIVTSLNKKPLEYYKTQKQIKLDCY